MDPQATHFVGRHDDTVVVACLDFEAGDHLAQRAAAHVVRLIGDEDVPHLRGAETVQQRHAEELVPPAMKLGGKRLAGRGREAKAR